MTAIKATKKQVRENVFAKIEAALKDVTVTAHQKKFLRKLKKASHLVADFIWELDSKPDKKPSAKKTVKKTEKRVVKKKAAKKGKSL
ncbi:MAG: hypothetical protein QM725_16675 [Lacibacter sp.]